MEKEVHQTAHFSLPLASSGTLALEVRLVMRIVEDPMIAPVGESPSSPIGDAHTHEYVHMFAGRISDANKKGFDSLSYWRNGFKGKKAYILNEALAQYLAQYPESQRPIPSDEK